MKLAFPKVSIITPTYNYGHFIEDTIKSVLDQDYPNIEYIVLDGNSTDNTVEILQSFEEDHRFKWISEPDDGQADAIAKGFDMATGDIFAWLCSDDIYLPGAVSSAVNVLRGGNYEFVFGDALHIDQEGNFLNYNVHPGYHPSQFRVLLPICQPASFWTKELYYAAGGVNKTYTQIMDRELLWRMSKKSSFCHLQKFVCGVRIHEETKTNRLFATVQREETAQSEQDMGEKIAPLYFAQYLNGFNSYPTGLQLFLRALFSIYNTTVRFLYVPLYTIKRSITRTRWLLNSQKHRGKPWPVALQSTLEA